MKYLFVQEFVRVDHTIQHQDGSITIDYGQSATGKRMKKKLKKHKIDPKDVGYAYMYNQVPEVVQTNRQGTPTKYKDVTAKQAKPHQEQLIKKIVEEKPEVVLPNGKLGSKFFADRAAITKVRGIPEEKTLEYGGESHTFWVLPIYSIEYTSVMPSKEPFLDTDLSYLARYDKEGETVFQPSYVEYTTLDTYEDVAAYFNKLRQEKKVVAIDFESNTLRPELNGAKALSLHMTNEEGEGYSVPLEHKDFEWDKEEFDSIMKMLRNLLATPDIPKVMHGGRYDIRLLISVYGFSEFESIYDTQIAYWMTVTQDKETSFRLTDLTYEYTDIGGYDAELEQWKVDYIKEYKDPETGKKVTPVNEIDGSNFNYEWFPLDMLLYYGAGDVDATLRIHNALWENIKKDEDWTNLYTFFYPRLTRSLARIESRGLYVDQDYREVLEKAYKEEHDNLLEDIRSLPSVQILEERKQLLYEAGVEEFAKPPKERNKEIFKFRGRYKDPEKRRFNPNSPGDKGEVMFDILGVELPLDKNFVKKSAMERRPRSNAELTWEDYSTNKHALEEIMENPDKYSEEAAQFAEKLSNVSKVSKLKSSFVDKAKTDTADDGAIHGSFKETGTATLN